VQKFKGDDLENRFIEAGTPVFDTVSNQLDLLDNDIYNVFPLGGAIYDANASPLSNAIPRNIFIESFNAIFTNFTVAGTFESYIEVFKRIFGDDVDITFTVPDPGQLEIDILASGTVLSDMLARYIENNEYIFDEIVDDEGDNIAFQTIKGFETQSELERMLFEMVPAGIYTEITLSFAE